MQYMSLIIVPELYATKFFIPCEIVPVLVDKEKEKKNVCHLVVQLNNICTNLDNSTEELRLFSGLLDYYNFLPLLIPLVHVQICN